MFNWKEMANKRAKQISDVVKIHRCAKTKIELYFKVKDKVFPFESFGKCPDCKKDYHYSALKMAEGLGHDEWPVQYLGYSCKTCYYKDEISIPDLKLGPIEEY